MSSLGDNTSSDTTTPTDLSRSETPISTASSSLPVTSTLTVNHHSFPASAETLHTPRGTANPVGRLTPPSGPLSLVATPPSGALSRVVASPSRHHHHHHVKQSPSPLRCTAPVNTIPVTPVTTASSSTILEEIMKNSELSNIPSYKEAYQSFVESYALGAKRAQATLNEANQKTKKPKLDQIQTKVYYLYKALLLLRFYSYLGSCIDYITSAITSLTSS